MNRVRDEYSSIPVYDDRDHMSIHGESLPKSVIATELIPFARGILMNRRMMPIQTSSDAFSMSLLQNMLGHVSYQITAPSPSTPIEQQVIETVVVDDDIESIDDD
jgi:hypothetical protein